MTMKKGIRFILLIIVMFAAPSNVFADRIQVEGTVQGIFTTLSRSICPPGEEQFIAAVEKTFVLITDEAKWYWVPTFTSAQIAPYINKSVRIEGDLVLNGSGINAAKVEVLEDGEWVVVYSPEIMKEIERNRKLAQGSQKILSRLN